MKEKFPKHWLMLRIIYSALEMENRVLVIVSNRTARSVIDNNIRNHCNFHRIVDITDQVSYYILDDEFADLGSAVRGKKFDIFNWDCNLTPEQSMDLKAASVKNQRGL